MSGGRGVRAALGALLVCLAVGPRASLLAHPVATTAIQLMIHDRTVEVSVDSETDPLLTKLTVLAGEPAPPSSASDAARRDLLTRLLPTLASTLDVRIDDVRVTLTPAGVVDVPNSSVPRVLATFAAVLPNGSRDVTFRSSLVFGSYPLTLHRDGVPGDVVEWLAGPQASAVHAVATTDGVRGWAAIGRDFRLGYTHILPNGLDHILFVLGLFLLSTRWQSTLAQVSAFTLAHSITLGLTLYGVVSLPSSVVEPLIALSIVYVAIENVMTSSLSPWRLALVFAFGLLHGMGFAEALSRLHLERSQFLTTLISFNVGVEAGQLSVIAVAAAVVALSRVPAPERRRLIVRPASLAIASIGVFWVVQRIL
jgi:hydrogenase/urease accessory protein HupE